MPDKSNEIENITNQDIETKLINEDIAKIVKPIAKELTAYHINTQIHEKDIARRLTYEIDESRALSNEFAILLMQREVKIRTIFENHNLQIDDFRGLEKKLLRMISNDSSNKDISDIRKNFVNILEIELKNNKVIKEK